MFRFILVIFVLSFITSAHAINKNQIIQSLEKIDNFSFNFEQKINEKTENGQCIIKYPKKIFCSYNDKRGKIIVSNGKSLVIKNRNSGSFYIYPLKKTPLEFILDKKYLINKINNSKLRNIDNKYANFRFVEDENEINIFFDNETYNLIGWQLEDIYQNLNITFISIIEINQKIKDSQFKLPKKD